MGVGVLQGLATGTQLHAEGIAGITNRQQPYLERTAHTIQGAGSEVLLCHFLHQP